MINDVMELCSNTSSLSFVPIHNHELKVRGRAFIANGLLTFLQIVITGPK